MALPPPEYLVGVVMRDTKLHKILDGLGVPRQVWIGTDSAADRLEWLKKRIALLEHDAAQLDVLNEARGAVERLRAENATLAEERDLAVAHDRQPYPTAWAYEQACKAQRKWQARAEEAEARLFPSRIYCPTCGEFQPLRADEPRLDPPSPEGDPDALWGDLCCGVCSVVITTVDYERPKP